MSPRPRVAVVVAAYQHGRYLADALRSALEQDPRPAEVVVVDDGSTDDTAAVAARFAPRVRWLPQRRQGARAARNTGLAATTAPLVAFLDADDWWAPGALGRLADALTAPGVGLAAPTYVTVDAAGRPLQEFRRRRRTPPAEMTTESLLLFDADIPGCVYRREVFDACGAFDTGRRHAGDYEMFLRVSLRFRIRFVEEAVLFRRVHPERLSAEDVARVESHLHYVRRFCAANPEWTRAHAGLARRATAKLLERRARALALAASADTRRAAADALRAAPFRPKNWLLLLAPDWYRRRRTGRRAAGGA